MQPLSHLIVFRSGLLRHRKGLGERLVAEEPLLDQQIPVLENGSLGVSLGEALGFHISVLLEHLLREVVLELGGVEGADDYRVAAKGAE
jgi:hypothetical protein